MEPSILQPIGIKGPKYREVAYGAIKEAILDGRLGSDQPLVEEQLAALLNISRTPVREALAILEHEGLIGTRGGRGFYVRGLSRSEFLELFVANETIEPYLVRRAAYLATEDQIQVIGEVIARGKYYAAKGDITQFLRSGRDFHRLVGLAAGNNPLADFIVRSEERTDLYLINTGRIIDSETMLALNSQHEAILNAVIRRDPDEAARLVSSHAQSIRARFADLFNNDQTDP